MKNNPWFQEPQPTKITGELHISWQADYEPEDINQWKACISAKVDDYWIHLDLDFNQTKLLQKWLNEYIDKKESGRKQK